MPWNREDELPAPSDEPLICGVLGNGEWLLLGECWKGRDGGWFAQDCNKPLASPPTHWTWMPHPPKEARAVDPTIYVTECIGKARMMRVTDTATTVIIADPPWPHANGSRTNSGKSPKYPLMNLREIAALGEVVRGMAGENAVLYLWATTPHLPGAISTMDAWGFRYRSLHVWAKRRIAAGFWARSNAEMCLIGERGAPAAPPASLLPTTILVGDRSSHRHSAKSDDVHCIVERLWPGSHKIELFARSERPGWLTFGSDLGSILRIDGVHVTSPII